MYEPLMRDYGTLARLYVGGVFSANNIVDLDQPQAHFLGTVMRKRVGDTLRVFNAEAGEWLAEIVEISKRKASVNILEQLRMPVACPDIWLLFAPLKKTRNAFIIEKATELGVSLLQPVMTARTTSKIRTDKMSAQIIEAAEQTERLDLPQVCAPQKLGTILENWDETRALIFADEEGPDEGGPNEEREETQAAQILAKIKTPCAILIGPEGGFTDIERTLLRSKPYVTPISLGPRILRADTAALATLALWQAVSGDW